MILDALDNVQPDFVCFVNGHQFCHQLLLLFSSEVGEGTAARSRTAEMLPFRNGCFKAAQRAKVPVVVASIHNSENITKQGPFIPTPVTLRICGVIDAETVCAQKATQLGDEVRRMLEESLAK